MNNKREKWLRKRSGIATCRTPDAERNVKSDDTVH